MPKPFDHDPRDIGTVSDVTLMIPASGFSARFGSEDKLLAKLGTKALTQHCLDALAGFGFARRIAVLPEGERPRRDMFTRSGFEIITNPSPEAGMARSVAIGAAACETHRLLLCLPDMPCVPQDHIAALLAASEGLHSGVVMSRGDVAQPPALIIGPMIAKMAVGLSMRDHITATVPLSPELLKDIDTTDDLAELSRNWLTGRGARDRNAS